MHEATHECTCKDLAGEEQRSRLCEKKCLPITAARLGDFITKCVKGARCGGHAGEQEAQFTARLDYTVRP